MHSDVQTQMSTTKKLKMAFLADLLLENHDFFRQYNFEEREKTLQ